ncbi:hypothetical protein MJ575_23155 [Klebsiella pneumoniae]|nr:hypothetical protein MJ575_23155 [Klebsiella pneumoniae]
MCSGARTALIALLAYIGSYVPAQKVETGPSIVSLPASARRMTRQRPLDLMVEMTETANILHNATEHSSPMDEIGRGTSTYDGLAAGVGLCGKFGSTKSRR